MPQSSTTTDGVRPRPAAVPPVGLPISYEIEDSDGIDPFLDQNDLEGITTHHVVGPHGQVGNKDTDHESELWLWSWANARDVPIPEFPVWWRQAHNLA